MPGPVSLRARGLQWLAQREHSRSELRRKLLAHVRAQAREQEREHARAALAATTSRGDTSAAPAADTMADTARDGEPSLDAEARAQAHAAAIAEVDAALDWLQAHQYLSDTRFVESRIHAREARYGNRRIQQELSHHGVALDAEATQRLKQSEFERARRVWQRKFGDPSDADASAGLAERARQMRFLAARGFSTDVIRRVVNGSGDVGSR